ncbi:ABC transporter permease [Candidatus Geothermarchaeota archaeon ex4572_27]|nr:MAG: ABC transporter permease [Candidatus Geothermarchaeota archaeon ex4572_27]
MLARRRRIELMKERAVEFAKIYFRNRYGVAGLIILMIFVFMAVFAPYIAPYEPDDLFLAEPFSPPSPRFLLGTDELGRDIFSLMIYGAQTSLLVGILASILTVLIGTLVGIYAGYYGGIIQSILMRLTDFFLILPALPLMIVLAAILGPSIWNIILVIAIVSWPVTARVIMSQTLSVKESSYVEACRALGGSDTYIIFRHILPNVTPLMFAYVILNIAGAVLSEAGLSFLGLGDPSHISWGMLLYYAHRFGALVSGLWWYIIPPGLAIACLVLAFMMIGYALDEIINPRIRRR